MPLALVMAAAASMSKIRTVGKILLHELIPCLCQKLFRSLLTLVAGIAFAHLCLAGPLPFGWPSKGNREAVAIGVRS